MRARLAPTLAVLAVVTAGACSDDDDDDAAVPTTASVAAFCDATAVMRAANERLDGVASDSTADEVGAAFAELRAAYDRVEGAAPGDIADTVADAARAFDDVIGAVAAADYDLASVERDVYTAARERYVSAAEAVESYVTAEC